MLGAERAADAVPPGVQRAALRAAPAATASSCASRRPTRSSTSTATRAVPRGAGAARGVDRCALRSRRPRARRHARRALCVLACSRASRCVADGRGLPPGHARPAAVQAAARERRSSPTGGRRGRWSRARSRAGQLHEDALLYTGKIGRTPTRRCFPFPVDDAGAWRAASERFNIYCSPCHGRTGDGNGMIVQRGYRQPPSYHDDRLRNAPVGYFFDVITNGFGAMPDYAAQVPAARPLGDRRLHPRAAAEPARARSPTCPPDRARQAARGNGLRADSRRPDPGAPAAPAHAADRRRRRRCCCQPSAWSSTRRSSSSRT